MRAYVALGANLGDAKATVAQAMDALDALAQTRVVARSSVYRSAPFEATGPDFYNAVAALETELAPVVLLAELQQLELKAGRERPYRNAPRTLDLDLLLHGASVLDSPTLTLPHPRMLQRAFVLLPLAEIAPDLVTPQQIDAVAGQVIERI